VSPLDQLLALECGEDDTAVVVSDEFNVACLFESCEVSLEIAERLAAVNGEIPEGRRGAGNVDYVFNDTSGSWVASWSE
jgi:hypothetical protein